MFILANLNSYPFVAVCLRVIIVKGFRIRFPNVLSISFYYYSSQARSNKISSSVNHDSPQFTWFKTFGNKVISRVIVSWNLNLNRDQCAFKRCLSTLYDEHSLKCIHSYYVIFVWLKLREYFWIHYLWPCFWFALD